MIASLEMRLPAERTFVPLARRQIDALLKHMHVESEDIHKAGLIVTEACSNVVRHAYNGAPENYSLSIIYSPERLVISIADEGVGFDPGTLSSPSPGQIGGYGLCFIREAADSFQITTEHGTTITAELRLHYRTESALHFARSLDKSNE